MVTKGQKIRKLQNLRRFWRSILNEKNEGVRRRLISHVDGVVKVSWSPGWTKILSVTMDDGWEHSVSNVLRRDWYRDLFQDMARDIIRRTRLRMRN